MSESPAWTPGTLRGVANVLGDTESGLTGRQIAELLARLRIADVAPSAAKRDRLVEAFINRQNSDRSAKRIITFITTAMEPAVYRDHPELFTLRQDRLNEVLTFAGLRVTDQGKVGRGAASTTLDEASRHASSLRAELQRRRTHDQVLAYCTIELLKKNNFHAQLKASKSVFDRLRHMTGADGDGAGLVDEVLALGQSGTPRIAINALRTQTEKDEQKGFANLIKASPAFTATRSLTTHG